MTSSGVHSGSAVVDGFASLSAARIAVTYALAQRGKSYLWGGTGPDRFDCSGLTQRAWAQAGRAIGRTTYPATAQAVVDSIALVWPSAAWPRLVATHPGLAVNTLQTVGSRLQDAHTRVVEMSTEQVERRVAHALLRLAQRAGRKVEAGVETDFPITRQDVAEMTGTTLHTVSRILTAWESQGLVEGGWQRIMIRDPHRLFMLAEGSPG